MGQTVTFYDIFGTSKAKTNKAILVMRDNLETWLPLSVAQVKFIGKDYQVKVTVPGWFYNKISWKPLSEFKPKAKPANPYIGSDVGNMMEERMVLEEMNPEDPRIKLIDEAVAVACA
jgi:hypothetical protein